MSKVAHALNPLIAMKLPAYKVRYAFSSAKLPFGLAELHAEYAREALTELFDIDPAFVEVSFADTLEDGEEVSLVAYSSRTCPSGTLIVKASQAVMPAYRATVKQAASLIEKFSRWLPQTAQDTQLSLVHSGLAPRLTAVQRIALERIACEQAGVGSGDAEFMSDYELARIVRASAFAQATI